MIFKYFIDDEYNRKRAGLLERYKRYNGMENNSPIANANDLFPRSNYLTPRQWRFECRQYVEHRWRVLYLFHRYPPNKMQVGNKYLVDMIDGQESEHPGKTVRWYLFRIPIRQFEGKVGDISGFKTIRYIRTISWPDWENPVILRMANFRTVGNRWRRYEGNLEDARFGEVLEPNLDNFTVSVVNIEENSAHWFKTTIRWTAEARSWQYINRAAQIERTIRSTMCKRFTRWWWPRHL